MRQILNWLYMRASGGESRPVVYDIDAVCPALRELEQHCPAIRDELLALLPTSENIPKYHELDPGRSHISSAADKAAWRVFLLYAMGIKPEKNRARCPQTSALLDKIPGLFQAFFSILEPGKNVPLHHSPYAGYLRYHLGLAIPTENAPWMRVKDQRVDWKQCEGILFCDYWNHEVFNTCDETRVVLVVDILRPMPWWASALNRFVTAVYIRHIYGRMITKAGKSYG